LSVDTATESAPAAESAVLPTVTVVIPTRDRPEMLKRAVEAVLGQTYSGDVECIAVFDQSDPEPIDVEIGPRRTLRAVRNSRNPGLAGARNTGVLSATGSLIAFCDDDDEWMPGKLEQQVELLTINPKTVIVGCGIVMRQGEVDIAVKPGAATVTLDDLLRSRVLELNPCTLLARLDFFRDRVGLVDESLPGGYAEDYDWLLRAASLTSIPMISAPLVRINWHRGSFFQSRWATIVDSLTYLLAKHPEFERSPQGRGRILGQIAFAQAAQGKRRQARQTAGRCLRSNWLEPRAYLALAVAFHLLSPELVLRAAHARGKGI